MNKVKEVNLTERIRSVQRSEKANRKCANCSESGPIYICLDYHTFVCTECSGIHRDLGHKVKSITMSNWTREEVDAIEFSGGNARDREIYLATYIEDALPRPRSQDREDLRRFVRLKYIDKRWISYHQPPETDASAVAKKKKKASKLLVRNEWDDDGILSSPSKPPTVVGDESRDVEIEISAAVEKLILFSQKERHRASEIAREFISRIHRNILAESPSYASGTIDGSSNPFDDESNLVVQGIHASSPQLSHKPSLPLEAVSRGFPIETKTVVSTNPFDSYS